MKEATIKWSEWKKEWILTLWVTGEEYGYSEAEIPCTVKDGKRLFNESVFKWIAALQKLEWNVKVVC